jgi:hypothetical protein
MFTKESTIMMSDTGTALWFGQTVVSTLESGRMAFKMDRVR